MTLKRITVRKLQSIREAVLELPETGIVRFYGSNSNGKSIIVKALDDTISGNLTKPKVRLSLVNDKPGNTWGEIEFETYSGTVLIIHIHHEAAQTWAQLSIPGEEPVKRYLADKNMPELVRRFGWHYNAERDISLNVCDSDDAVLFFKTSHRTNYDVLDSAMTDEFAVKSLEEFERLNQEAKNNKAKFKEQINVAEAAIANIKVWDIQQEETKKSQLIYLCNNLEKMLFPNIPKIQAIPRVTVLSLNMPKMPKIRRPFVLDTRLSIPDIIPIGKELNQLLLGICPTCNKPLVEEHAHVG